MVLVFGGVLWVPDSFGRIRLVVVLIGVLVLEAGVWGLAHRILPSTRHYVALREEGNHFIALIRNLNAAALARNEGVENGEEHFQEILSDMHASVERMGEVADKKD